MSDDVKVVRLDAPRDVVSQQGPPWKPGHVQLPKCSGDNHVWWWANTERPADGAPCLCGAKKYETNEPLSELPHRSGE